MDKYHERRLVLEAVRAMEPAPATLPDINRYSPLEMAGLAGGPVGHHAFELCAQGYLENLRPGREPLYRLSQAGRAQLGRETDLDEYIWGEFASRFSR